MTEDQQLIEGSESALQPETTLRNERREFFRAALGAAAATAAGAGALSIATSASAATIVDNDMGNFLLQLEYLVAQYYSFAVTGAGLPAAQLTGVGTAGAATGASQVTFTDPLVAQYVSEIRQDLAAHVAFLRATLGTDGATAQPAIDLGTGASGGFSKLAVAAGIAAAGCLQPLCQRREFPARRLHDRGRHRHRLCRCRCLDLRQGVPRQGPRPDLGAFAPHRGDPLAALCEGRRDARAQDECGQDLRRPRLARR